MTKATKPVYNHLAVVFDFDDTLAPDTLDSLLESCGVDSDVFERQRVRPLVEDGWDEILAKFHSRSAARTSAWPAWRRSTTTGIRR